MATKKTPNTSHTRTRTPTKRRTPRRRTTSRALQPRRRRSTPGLPTTVGTALGALVVTTLLDLSWPLRIALIAIVLTVGLAYVVWRSRAAIAAGGAAPAVGDSAGRSAVEPPAPASDTVDPTAP